MNEQEILRQRAWTEDELLAAGFRYFPPRKRLVMARLARHVTNIEITIETLRAAEGDIICYDPGNGSAQPQIEDYDHWPVNHEIFEKTYRRWDERDWQPNAAEMHLLMHRCHPYYKWVGIWALRLPFPIYAQSLESPEPIIIPRGRWLCIGSSGEPYHMNDEAIRARYLLEDVGTED